MSLHSASASDGTQEAPLASADTSVLTDAECTVQLDAAAEQLRRGDTQAAETALRQLLGTCPDTPQVQHNLAVVDAGRAEWEAAVNWLLESIALDGRASASIESLRDIHRWRAAEAYARALNGKQTAQQPPVLQVQSSVDVNSDTHRRLRRDESLFDDATVQYELWEWWRSAANPSSEQHRAHYSAKYSGASVLSSLTVDELPDWEAVSRNIRFVGPDALALISWTTDDDASSTNDVYHIGHLLLMRVEDNRWRIYETLPLP